MNDMNEVVDLLSSDHSELDFEIYCHLDDFSDDVNELFDKCIREIKHAYFPVRTIFNNERRRLNKQIKKKALKSSLRCFKVRSIEDQLIAVHILGNVYDGYTEGFSFDTEKHSYSKHTMMANAVMVLMDMNTEKMLIILRNQHCEIFR